MANSELFLWLIFCTYHKTSIYIEPLGPGDFTHSKMVSKVEIQKTINFRFPQVPIAELGQL